MALQPFEDKQLNYFKFASIVLNEFPKALRQTFRSMWDNTFGHRPGFQPWDDSMAVRNMFLTTEGGSTRVPTNLSYEEWDCAALFQATIYARSFALPDCAGHHKTLRDLYVIPLKLARDSYHVSVVSPDGNQAKTFALAIDQLRRLRNSLCHPSSSEIVKATFDQYVQIAKNAFKALGVNTDPIDAIGSLTDSDFPTKEVRKLEQAVKEETRAYIKFLEGVSSSIDEFREILNTMKAANASKDDIARLEQKIDDLREAQAQEKPGSKASQPIPCLPPMVPYFTGRQKECEEIASHLTSRSTRILSIWGSPGFGKTATAIAVGHNLLSQGLAVYYLSLRRPQSNDDLESTLLSLFRRTVASEQQSQQRLSIADELYHLLSKMPDPFTIILDDADEFLSKGPKVKEDFTNSLAEILRQIEKVAFVITTRESLEFMNVQFQEHQGVRISPLDESSSQNLVNELLLNASVTDCKRVSKICGHVPLAMKLLCSFISEDGAVLSQVIDDFIGSLQNQNIVELLDKPDYPSNLRLELLFDSSFQRLSALEKEALVSLSVLPESFDLTVAAAVLGISRSSTVAKRVLHNLRRKSLLDSSSEPETFLMHQLILSFARKRGENEMKEVLLKSKARLSAFYVTRFKDLNEQFLTSQSMSAFIDFYKDEQCITQSLIDGSSNLETAKDVFEILVNADIFLCSLYRRKRAKFSKIYDPAIKAAKMLENKNFYRQLLVSKAFFKVTWGTEDGSMKLLSNARDVEESCYPVSENDRGKHLCYNGICQLAHGKTEDGIQCLKDAVSLMNSSPEHRILSIIVFQILAIYHGFKKNSVGMSQFYSKALKECKTLGDTELLVIPKGTGKELPEAVKEDLNQRNPDASDNQPLNNEIIFIIEAATKMFCDDDTKQSLTDATLNIAEQIKKPTLQTPLGLFHFQNNVMALLCHLGKYDVAATLSASRISFQETTHKRSKTSKQRQELAKSYCKDASISYNRQNYLEALKSESRALEIKVQEFGDEHESTAESHQTLGRIHHALDDVSSALLSTRRALDIRRKLFGEDNSNTAESYHLLGLIQRTQGDFLSALYSTHRALDIRVKLFGEEHPSTAESYHSLGFTQHLQGDFSSALLFKQLALQVRRNLFGEDHSSTADSYISLWVTQHQLEDFSSALQSAQRAVAITRNHFGEKHSRTAESYLSLGTTQHAQGNFSSAFKSLQLALDIRIKLFGEEHSDTADSYHLLGNTQHALGDLSSALQSRQRALTIRLKLLGEEHSSTAMSYHSLGITQLQQGDFSSALKCFQRALDIRRKIFGEKHPSTAESYHLTGDTQHALRDFVSALQCKQRALKIRLALFGEKHSSTADSYHSLGNTQYEQGDFDSALQSTSQALDICRKRYGEEHLDTALSYYSLGVIQHELGEFSSAFQSTQRALDIRIKLLGEEHSNTADSYHSLGATQHALGDVSSAILSKQRALNIRFKLFGDEHSSTADSYYSLSITQHALGELSLALQSSQRALDIRLKLFEEEHSSTADSCYVLGLTQHALGDLFSAVQSKKRALDIRLKLFGEENSSTASRYHSLGVTQHEQGNFSSALESFQSALNIRRKLFGEEHPSTAYSYHLLGLTQRALGDLFSAVKSKQRSLDIRLKLFGEENSSTASCYHSLGVTQLALGDVSSARLSYRCALDIRLKMFGEGHPSTITSYNSLRRIQHKPDGIGDTASPSPSNDTEADSDRTIESATAQRDTIGDTASPSSSNDTEADTERKREPATGQRDTIGDTDSPSSSNYTEADCDRKRESATGQRV